MDAEITGHMRDRQTALEHETDGALAQLIGVLPRGRHDWSISFPQDRAWRRSLQETQGPTARAAPVPGSLNANLSRHRRPEGVACEPETSRRKQSQVWGVLFL